MSKGEFSATEVVVTRCLNGPSDTPTVLASTSQLKPIDYPTLLLVEINTNGLTSKPSVDLTKDFLQLRQGISSEVWSIAALIWERLVLCNLQSLSHC
jgi:hypothetical protein